MTLPNTIPNRVSTYGTTYPAPGDVDALMANDSSLDSRLGVVEYTTVRAVTGNTTLVLADVNKSLDVTSASTVTVTVPPNSSVAFPVGSMVSLARLGVGAVTVAAGAGVTVNPSTTLSLRAQYSTAALRKTGTDTWLLMGDIA